jgi:hypothetical protein
MIQADLNVTGNDDGRVANYKAYPLTVQPFHPRSQTLDIFVREGARIVLAEYASGSRTSATPATVDRRSMGDGVAESGQFDGCFRSAKCPELTGRLGRSLNSNFSPIR